MLTPLQQLQRRQINDFVWVCDELAKFIHKRSHRTPAVALCIWHLLPHCYKNPSLRKCILL